MTRFNYLTLFPDMFGMLNTSMIKKAVDHGLIELTCLDIRDFSKNKHKKVDDYPYGGGCGMIMTCQPVLSAFESLEKGQHCIYLSAKGERLTQKKVLDLSRHENLTMLCGHYEGIDQRALDAIVDEEISIGDYVLTGGELPAMVLTDAIVRVLPGVLASEEAVTGESHYSGLLEHPQYTRPETFNECQVPEILLSGNHREIERFRHLQSLVTTYLARPDMLMERGLSEEEGEMLAREIPEIQKEMHRFMRKGDEPCTD
ncbi:MAG: tRNA (guanosine(37)-N1)-methyltransferase TrmD [Clostridia bacterium]